MRVGCRRTGGVKRRGRDQLIQEGIGRPLSQIRQQCRGARIRQRGGGRIGKPPWRIRRCGGGGKHRDSQSKVTRSVEIGIPDDIILNILNRLPLRSLCRFMCVSKSWGSLILHRFASQQRRPLFGMLGMRPRVRPESDSLPNQVFCSIDTNQSDGNGILVTHASTPIPDGCRTRYCNGLFCYPHNRHALAVWDSTTATTQILPKTHFPQFARPFMFDLGFDPLSNTYKVLVWTYYPHCEIYTLPTTSNSTSHWRPLTHTTNGRVPVLDVHRHRALLDVQNICTRNQTMLYWYTLADSLLSFDFSLETFASVPFPNQVKLRSSDSQVESPFEVDACFCLVNHHFRPPVTIDLWMLTDSNAWVMMARVLPPAHSLVYPPLSTRTGEFLLTSSLNVAQGTLTLYLYNIFTRQHDTIQVNGLDAKENKFRFLSNSSANNLCSS